MYELDLCHANFRFGFMVLTIPTKRSMQCSVLLGYCAGAGACILTVNSFAIVYDDYHVIRSLQSHI